MKPLLTLIFLLTVSLAFSQTETDSTLLIGKLSKALKSYYEGNVDQYSELFSEASTLTIQGETWTGKQEIIDGLSRVAPPVKDVSFELVTPAITRIGESFILKYKIKENTGVTWIVTDIFESKEGQWALLHSHHSSTDDNYMRVPHFAFYAIIALCALFSFAIGRFSKNANPNTSPSKD